VLKGISNDLYIHKVWRSRLKKSKKDHERAMTEQMHMVHQVKDDLQRINKRCESLTRQLQQVKGETTIPCSLGSTSLFMTQNFHSIPPLPFRQQES